VLFRSADLLHTLDVLHERAKRHACNQIKFARQEVDHLESNLEACVQAAYSRNARSLQQLERRLALLAPTRRLQQQRQDFQDLLSRLHAASPDKRIAQYRGWLEKLSARLTTRMQQELDTRRRGFAHTTGKLDALSPLRVLDRGYAIVTAAGVAITNAKQLNSGDQLDVRCRSGGAKGNGVRTNREEEEP